MSGEKKRFKLNGAVVNHCAMDHDLAEQCVDLATAAVRDYYTEQVRKMSSIPLRWGVMLCFHHYVPRVFRKLQRQ
jgi:hypothetical protein